MDGNTPPQHSAAPKSNGQLFQSRAIARSLHTQTSLLPGRMRASSPLSTPGQLETPLEAQRRAIIARNQKRLAELGLLSNPLSAAAEERRRREREERQRQEAARRQAVLAGDAPATEPQRRSRRLCGEQPEMGMRKKLPSCSRKRRPDDEAAAEVATPWPSLRQPPLLLGSRSFIEQARHDLLLLDDEDELQGGGRGGQQQRPQRAQGKRRRLSEGALRARMDRHNEMRIRTWAGW